MKTTTKRTAAKAHHEHAAAIAKLAQELAHHAATLDAQARNKSHDYKPTWGDAATLAHVRDELTQISNFTFNRGEHAPEA